MTTHKIPEPSYPRVVFTTKDGKRRLVQKVIGCFQLEHLAERSDSMGVKTQYWTNIHQWVDGGGQKEEALVALLQEIFA